MTPDLERIERAVHEILLAIGEDPSRDGLLETPQRVARMYAEVCSGVGTDPSHHLENQLPCLPCHYNYITSLPWPHLYSDISIPLFNIYFNPHNFNSIFLFNT